MSMRSPEDIRPHKVFNQLVQRFFHTSTTKDPELLNRPDNLVVTRRNALETGIRTVATIALALDGIQTAIQVGKEVVNIWDLHQLQDQLNSFLVSPSPDTLVENSFHHDEELVFTPEQFQQLSFYIFGDSMNLVNGQRHDSQGGYQEGSYGQLLADMPKTFPAILPNFQWHCNNYAVPGETSKEVMQDRQLGNKDIQKQLQEDPGQPVVIVGLNGDDWRILAQTAQDLSSAIELMKKTKQLDQVTAQKLMKLMGEFESVSEQFGKNLQPIVDTLSQINETRKNANPKQNEITLLFTLPINLGNVDIIPFAPLNQNTKPEVIHVDTIPNGPQIAYKVTAAIYQQTNNRAPGLFDFFTPRISFVTHPMIGFEDKENIDPDTGHFNLRGHKNVANTIAERFVVLTDQGKLAIGKTLQLPLS